VHQLTLFEAAQYEESMRRAGLIAIESIESPMPDRDRYVAVVPT
jgi:hypothetical protein